MEKKKIIFIINPISGGLKKDSIPDQVERILDQNLFDYEILISHSAKHTHEFAESAVAQNTDIVVAVGGDGTANNIAKYLKNTSILFGLIPMGSGNGFARHLEIPVNTEKALQVINEMKTAVIDTGTVNGEFFLNVTGVGFDAHVSRLFSNAPKRGFFSYAKITLNEFLNYKSQNYELIVDGKKHEGSAFILAVANGSQYGNNAFIAPQAEISDGFFEVTVLKPFKLIDVPVLATQLFTKRLHNTNLVYNFCGKEILIRRSNEDELNIDGEAVMAGKEIEIKMFPKSLNVIVGADNLQV